MTPDLDVTFSVKNEMSASFVPGNVIQELVGVEVFPKECLHQVVDIEEGIEYCVECGIDMEDMFE